jgi:hypothetical protein
MRRVRSFGDCDAMASTSPYYQGIIEVTKPGIQENSAP